MANKIQKQTESLSGAKAGSAADKAKDKVNWFGEKIGANASAGPATGGVGKYLKSGPPPSSVTGKRAGGSIADVGIGVDDKKKKRKMGFGDFDSW